MDITSFEKANKKKDIKTFKINKMNIFYEIMIILYFNYFIQLSII